MKNWQAQIAFWGALGWLGSFELGDFLMKDGQKTIALTTFGYTMGVITVFAGHIFWGRIVQGRWDELLGSGQFTRLISALSLVVIFAYGLFGLLNGIFNSNPWFYSFAFAIGGFVVNQGIVPLVDAIDNRRTAQ